MCDRISQLFPEWEACNPEDEEGVLEASICI